MTHQRPPRNVLRFPKWLEVLLQQLRGTDKKVMDLHPLLDLLQPSSREIDLVQTLLEALTAQGRKIDELWAILLEEREERRASTAHQNRLLSELCESLGLPIHGPSEH